MGKLAGKEDEIIQRYQNGETGNSLAKIFNCSRNSIYELLKRNDISRRLQVVYPINEHYFDMIDHQNKAYILGFLFADGYHYQIKNIIKLQLASKDKEILIKFREILSSPDKKLYQDKRDGSYSLELCNKHLSQQLEKLGMVQNKTFEIRVPFKEIKGFESHFVRGYYDGDGTISKRTKGNRWDVSITSNSAFVNDLNFLLKQFLDIEFGITQQGKVQDIRTSNKKKINLFLNWIYEDAELYLERKYLRAQNFLDSYC